MIGTLTAGQFGIFDIIMGMTGGVPLLTDPPTSERTASMARRSTLTVRRSPRANLRRRYRYSPRLDAPNRGVLVEIRGSRLGPPAT